MVKVYFAGPDVFYKDSDQIAENKKAALQAREITGIYPSDNKIENFSFSKETAAKIFQCNIDLMDECDVILANMTPWRGPSMDAGTISEIVYGATKGKLVIGYYEGDVPLYTERVVSHYKGKVSRNENGSITALEDNTSIENFEQKDNLMIPGFIKMSGGKIYNSFEEAVDNIQRLWNEKIAQQQK